MVPTVDRELRTIAHYEAEAGYIDALARSVRELWQHDGEPERLLLSFHGIPVRYEAAGDPYARHCRRTAQLLIAALGLPPERWFLSFQSRFGREKWLEPYTDATLRSWGTQGIKRVDVVCPGFAADCLETLEEIAVENAHIFKANGGENFAAIPCLNDSEAGMAVISHLVLRELQGWI